MGQHKHKGQLGARSVTFDLHDNVAPRKGQLRFKQKDACTVPHSSMCELAGKGDNPASEPAHAAQGIQPNRCHACLYMMQQQAHTN